MYYTGRLLSEAVTNKHISVALASVSKLREAILQPKTKMLCVNDVRLDEKRYELLRAALLEAFEQKFPQKSRFEK